MRRNRKVIFWAHVIAFVVYALGATARADFVIAFHGEKGTCAPCLAMEPVEKQARAMGCRIVTIEAPAHPELFKFYRVRSWPQYVYVIERGANQYDSGCRLKGVHSANDLLKFCKWPYAKSVAEAGKDFVGAIIRPLVP